MSDELIVSAETPPPPTRKISISFERKQDLGNYENRTARAFVEGIIPEDTDTAATAVALGNLFMAAAAAVYDQLDIAYDIDQDAQVIREVLKPTPHVEVKSPGNFTPNTPGGGGLRVMNPDEASSDPLPAWLLSQAASAGVTAVWDRRHSCKGNQPQFQEAAKPGQGHGKDGSAKGFWPPK